MRATPSRTSSTVPTSETSAVGEVGRRDLLEEDVLELAGTEDDISGHVVEAVESRFESL